MKNLIIKLYTKFKLLRSMMFREPVVRIILLGDSSTGKTSIIRKYTEDEFFYDTPMTLGKILLASSYRG